MSNDKPDVHTTRAKAVDAAKKKIKGKISRRVSEWIVKDDPVINGEAAVTVTFYSARVSYPPKVTEFYIPKRAK